LQRRTTGCPTINSCTASVLDTTIWEFVGALATGFGPDGMAWSALACEPLASEDGQAEADG
jgi:hypothetical protein